MADISLSTGVRQALRALTGTASLQQQQQLKLATGKRVNSAIDNPVNFFQAAGLSNRANDLSNLLDSIGQATKVLEAADKGIQSITKLMQAAQGSARQALQSTSTTNKIAGTGAAVTSLTNLADVAGGSFVNGTDTIDITIGSDKLTLNVKTLAASGDIKTVGDLVDAINSDTTLNPTSGAQRIKASIESGNLKIEGLSGEALKIESSNSTALSALIGSSTTTTYAAASENTTRSTLATQFDSLREQIDQLAADSGYNGINLLNSDNLKVQFNESNTASIKISGVKFNSSGLGVDSSTNKWQSDKDINDAIDKLTTGLNALRAQSSTFGSSLSVVQTRQDFTKNMIDTLQSGADQLVLADQNEEGAKLVTLNTRQQLANTSLSLATQAEQSVLRLFG